MNSGRWHRYIQEYGFQSPAGLDGKKGLLDVEVAAVDSPSDSRGPAGLRGNDPDTRRGGGDGTSYAEGSTSLPSPVTPAAEPTETPLPVSTATPGSNAATTPLPTDSQRPEATSEPTPPSSVAVPTAAPRMGCGQLCSEEFWIGGATVASVLAELDDGADLTAKGHYGTPVLGYALLTFGSNFEIVRLLLEAGTDPNAQDDSGSTPLHIAVQIAAYASRPEAPARFSGNTDDSLVSCI